MSLLTWLKRLLVFILLFFLIDFGISHLLLQGLNKYFGLQSDAPILLNGSSMTLAGFDKQSIEKSTHKKVAFYSRNGVSLSDRKAMLAHYFNNTTKKTSITVLEVNPLLFSKRFTASNVYMLFLPFMDDVSMQDLVKTNTDTKEYLVRKFIRTSRFNTDLIALSIKGYLGVYENKKTQVLDKTALDGLKRQENSVPVDLNAEKVALFKETLKLVEKHSSQVILVNMPIYETKMKTFKKSEYAIFLNSIKAFTKGKNNIVFLDLNQSEMTKNPNLFSDPLHLNWSGQHEATTLLLKTLHSK